MTRQATSPPSQPTGGRYPVPPEWRSRLSRQAASEAASETARPPVGDRQRQPPAPPAPAASAASRQSPAANAGDRQPPPPPPTHRIVAPPARQPDDTASEEEWDDGPLSLRERVEDAWNELRFVNRSPGSLRDQIEYARDGAYTVQTDGWWRTANIVFARFVAVPGLTVCYLVAWAFFTRLSRALVSWVVAPFLLMLLNRLPAIAMFVPDWADFTYWL